jgi:hypothetical protein
MSVAASGAGSGRDRGIAVADRGKGGWRVGAGIAVADRGSRERRVAGSGSDRGSQEGRGGVESSGTTVLYPVSTYAGFLVPADLI